MRNLNLLDECIGKDYEVFLITSYSTDLVFFEKTVLRNLLDHSCRYIGLFVDGTCFAEHLAGASNILELGRSYIVQPIYQPSVYHPKVCLMAGPKKAKILVGSFNVTPAGFVTNREIGTAFTFEIGNDAFLPAVQEVYHYFYSAFRNSPSSAMNSIFDQLSQYDYLRQQVSGDSEIKLLFNGKLSLQDSFVSNLAHNVKHIDIAAPYFDHELALLEEWSQSLKPDSMTIWLQDKTTNYPKKRRLPRNVNLHGIRFKSNGGKEPRYHGKIFCFQGEGCETLVYGSANCSKQAWLLNENQGGNAEAVVMETVEPGTFQSLMGQEGEVFPLDLFALVVVEPDESETSTSHVIQIINTEMTPDELQITLKSSTPVHEFCLAETQGEWILRDKMYSVRFPGNHASLASVFELAVKFVDGTTAFVPAWGHRSEDLHRIQTMISGGVYAKLEHDPELHDYDNVLGLLQDFLERLALTEVELELKVPARRTSAGVHQQAELNEETAAASDFTDDYYIAESPLVAAYGSINGRDVLGHVIQQLLQPFNVEGAAWDGSHTSSSPSITSKPSAATIRSLEHYVRRFTKKFRQGLASEAYLSKVTAEILLKNVVLYTEILWKLKKDQQQKQWQLETGDIWKDIGYIGEIICRYAESNVLDHPLLADSVIPQLLAEVIFHDVEADQMEDKGISRSRRKALSIRLETIHKSVIPIRSSYKDFLPAIGKYLTLTDIAVAFSEMEQRMERLFPFIPFEKIKRELSGGVWLGKKIDLKALPRVDYPHVVLYIDQYKGSGEFVLLQLHMMARTLRVEEWEHAPNLQITWYVRSADHPMEKYVLQYRRKQRQLIQHFTYRNGNKRHDIHLRSPGDIFEGVDSADMGFFSRR